MEPLTLSNSLGLVELAGRATLVLAAALLLSWALRRAAAGTRHLVWTTAFVLLLALPVAAAWLPAWELPVLPDSPGAVAAEESPAVVAYGTGTGATARPGGTAAADRVVRATPPGEAIPPTAEGETPIPVALLLWALGSAAAMVSVTIGTLRFRSLVRAADPVDDPVWLRQLARLRLRLGIDAHVRLLVSGRATTPMTGGWRRPVIVLPAGATSWTPERREIVLLHELIHVRRHDALRQLLGRAALALYWFHPLSWIASRRAAVSREEACDEAVLELGTRPSEYASHLLALAEGMHEPRPLAPLPMIQPSQLERRIMAILAPRRRRTGAVATAAMLLLFGGLGLSAAIARPVEAGPDVVVPALAVAAADVGVRAMPTVRPPSSSAGASAGPGVGTTAPVAPSPRTGEAAVIAQEEPTCRSDRWRGNFSGTISIRDDRQERVGWQNGDRIIQRFVDDLRLCMRVHGDVVMTDEWDAVRAIGRGGWVVLESEEDGLRRLVITEDADGIDHAWSVDGRERPFDDEARAWRDRMFTVLAAYWEASRLRGRESSLRGRISSHRGHISSLRGQMSSHRGHISSLRGRISSARGHVSSLNGRISSLRGRISSLRSARRATDDAETRRRLDVEIADTEARTRQVEEEIDEYDLEGRVADVRAEIAGYDLEGRVRGLEQEIEAYDLEGKLRDLEREIDDYDLDGKVRALEQEIEELDADRRAEAIERGVEPDIAALRRLIDGP